MRRERFARLTVCSSRADGTLAARYAYGPWGAAEVADEAGLGGWRNPLRFGAREYDAETGLYYNRARYYEPGLGRFISEGPIGLAGGVNLYAYAVNDPVNRTDPSGRKDCTQQNDCPPPPKYSYASALAAANAYLLRTTGMGLSTWLSANPVNPGVHVGSWTITTVGGLTLADAHHLGFALVERSGRSTFYDLVGWVDYRRSQIISSNTEPYYARQKYEYTWIQVAGPDAIPSFQRSIAAATLMFQDLDYRPGYSNTFAWYVLDGAGVSLTDQQRGLLGWTPGFGPYRPPN